ncbi:MAG: GWxTD domain-containing protein [Acidobacteriota bacterium]
MGARNGGKGRAGRGAVLCPLLLMGLGAGLEPTPAAQEETAARETVSRRIYGAGLPETGDADLSAWPEGPVRYLLSGPEVRLYQGLEKASERRAFIKQFWLRRDPDIYSLENEFRFQFWKRVVEANQLFTRTTVPGWQTDRGKFYILMGAPDEIESQVMPNQREGFQTIVSESDGSISARVFGRDKPTENFLGLERWIYRSRPAARLPPNFVLAFRLTSAGDYELSADPRDTTLYMNMLSEATGHLDQPLRLGEIDSGRSPHLLDLYNDVALALDYGTLNKVPQPEDLLAELVTSEEFFGIIPFLLRVDYYKAEDDRTLAVFTVGVDRKVLSPVLGGSPPDLLAMGRIESLENPAREVLLTGKEALIPSPDNQEGRLILFQGMKALRPGAYNASFGIMQTNNNRIGSHRQKIRVPAFPTRGLSLSSLALARRLTPLDELREEETGAAGPGPFRMGRYMVVPKTEPRFRSGDDFSLYYQVYGARTDPKIDQLNLEITYHFSVLTNGKFIPIGHPMILKKRSQPVQGWSFPLKKWPEATFRLEVTVVDLVSGDAAVGQTVFSVEHSQTSL